MFSEKCNMKCWHQVGRHRQMATRLVSGWKWLTHRNRSNLPAPNCRTLKSVKYFTIWCNLTSPLDLLTPPSSAATLEPFSPFQTPFSDFSWLKSERVA